ncbi:hypothetical protein V1520DRAFT_353585 [Lipomyces starkeyi]|uniref:NADP-dependent oxidoreductase domain-containing protein n=1 Tax=Lipomyces starkeyi NRRL Y-11557 TaxID=675824 RepID=A0A1E3Q215_LIPST|nr:hypothetical protein LIPSTDRAFT_28878 [Lipomyces starkeyi NRRL Y-11557]
MADLVKELSGCAPSMAAVQIEYSHFEIEAQRNGLLEACEEFSSPGLSENDRHRTLPRFQKENFDGNMKLPDKLKKLAVKKKATAGQIAFAWLIAKGAIRTLGIIIPIIV